jgi:NAD(P)-dependent dehydrogenase (short-subunit alcohol dehydrogenase family)
MTALRDELLAGRAIALGGPVTDGLADALRQLGARVEMVAPVAAADDEAVGGWAREHGPLQAVVHDARPTFGGGGPEALTETLEQSWLVVREVAVGALIEASEPGKVVLIGPSREAGPHAEAAAAALENLVRTLSVEWARYSVTTVMVTPGPASSEADLAELVAFLCSPAGEYLSGCRLDVSGSVSCSPGGSPSR